MVDDFRWAEVYRRLERLERITESVPVIARDVADLKSDIVELREDTRALRRALYTTALSVVSAAVIFAISVSQLLR